MKQPTREIAQNRTPKKGTKADFLVAYAETCSVSRAAKLSGIARRTHYDRLASDAAYKRAFLDVQEQAAQTLEDEAVRRAHEGTQRPVTVAGKKEIIREYSDTLLIFLLKGLRPEKYRERSEVKGVPLPTQQDNREMLNVLMDELKDQPEVRYRIAQRLHQTGREPEKVQ